MQDQRLHLTRVEAVRVLQRFMLALEKRPEAAVSAGNLAVRQGVYLIGSVLTKANDIGDVDLVLTVFAPGHERAVPLTRLRGQFGRHPANGAGFRKALVPRTRGVECQGQSWLGGDEWASPKDGRQPGLLDQVYPLWRAGEPASAWPPRVAALLNPEPVSALPALDPAVRWWPVRPWITWEANAHLLALDPSPDDDFPWARLLRWLVEWEVGWQHAPDWAAAYRPQAEAARDAYLDLCLETSYSSFRSGPAVVAAAGGAAGLLRIARTEGERMALLTDPRAAGEDLPDRF